MSKPLQHRYAGLLVPLTALLVAVTGMVVGCSVGSSTDVALLDSGTDSPSSDAGVEGASVDDATVGNPDAFVLRDAAPPPIECDASPCVIDISRGTDDTCALTSTGDVYCWGDNSCGEVGAKMAQADAGDASDAGDAGEGGAVAPPPDLDPVTAPRKVLTGARSISAGASSTCAILNDGQLRCWGSPVSAFTDTTSGGSGHTCTPNATPTAIAGVPKLTAVSTTLSNGCGVAEDKKLWCWGSNANALLGRAGYSACSYYSQCTTASYPPARADLVVGDVKDVLVSYGGIYVLDATNHLLTWGGSEALGRTSSLSVDPNPLPVLLADPSSFSVSLFGDGQYRGNNACVTSQGKVYCWGGYHLPPRVIALPMVEYAAQVSASLHSCVRTVDGTVFCWGGNTAGQLGDGTGVDHPLVPSKVEGLKAKAAKVVASKATTCALLVTGEVQCWGANDKGQVGIGSADFVPHLQPGPAVTFQ